jgi:hypothetical protein
LLTRIAAPEGIRYARSQKLAAFFKLESKRGSCCGYKQQFSLAYLANCCPFNALVLR